jgi:hypothetical protein
MQPLHRSDLQLSLRAAAIASCQACRDLCLRAVHHGLDQGGTLATPEHIGLLRGSAELCQTTTNFLLRGLDMKPILRASAQITERCAESCEVFPEDPLLQRCAEACLRCARACTELANSVDA